MVDFIMAWCLILISLCYSFSVAKLIPKGIKRLILIFPVFVIFFIVPFFISSVTFVSLTAFFISWLANFKLFLFALGRGPLSSYPKPLPLSVFLLVSCLPIKIQLSSKPKHPKSLSHEESKEAHSSYIIKAALFPLIFKVYTYSSYLPHKAVLTLYGIFIYFCLEVILAATAAAVRAMSDLELEPQFKRPYLATSLQDFWGRRWNLMVSQILRPTVYEPLGELLSNLGRKYSQPLAVFGTFLVSGIMHEIIFFYLGQRKLDWKMMWFFIINGFCTAAEIFIKKTINGRWRFPKVISRVLTLGFVMVTALWLFLPVVDRCNLIGRALDEWAAISVVAAKITRRITTSLFYKLYLNDQL